MVNSSILMKNFSCFCNEGRVLGPGKIYFERKATLCNLPDMAYEIDSSFFEFQDSSLINIPDSTNLIFKYGKLRVNPHCNIIFGKNSKITIKQGAEIKIDSSKITTANNDMAGGIFLENAGSNTKITNCTFGNCKTAITIKDSGGVYNNCEISNNTFNIPAGGDYGIYAKDVDSKVIKGNIFNLPLTKSDALGLYYKNISQTDSNIFVIPDSNTVTFKSKASSLTLFSKYSEIKMGAGSKLVFDSTTTFKADNIKFTALDVAKPWNGIFFKNMDTVIMNNCTIKGVQVDSSYNNGYSVLIYNSKNTNIDSCKIGDSTSVGGILLYFQNNSFYYPNVNISNNQIKTTSSIYNGINVAAYSSFMSSINIERNSITNKSGLGGGSGIYTYGIQSSTLKNNTISNFGKGIESLYCSFDVFQNEISTISGYDARCITGIGTSYNMGVMGEYWIGGGNKLNTQSGWCVGLDASSFNLNGGYNVFNITDYTYGYHLRGYFPITPTSDSAINVQENCFEVNGIPVSSDSEIKKYLIWANTSAIDVDFSYPTCGESQGLCAYYVVENSITQDTVWLSCDEPGGGGHKTEMKGGNNVSSPQEASYKEVYEAMNIEMRKKQYSSAETKCKTLIEQYADSLTSLEAIDKLYYASLVQDVNGSKLSPLKSYFEAYIQAHPENAKMIQRMFYFIQKCKAGLGQYTSAMQGFETIMNQFPSSYDGLAAKWDYMATSLLNSQYGTGGAEPESDYKVLTYKQEHDRLINLVEDPKDDYDKTKFTEKDRKIIVKNIVSSFEEQKAKNTKKLNELSKKIVKDKATDNEVRDYNVMTQLKEIVKVKRVRTINEQISSVQDDRQKIEQAEKYVGNRQGNDNVLPYDYKLSQNYPNPFNPTTKINYELKLAGFVSLKVYDLLGREIAELVNEKQDAGRYIVNFDANKYMLASGIYFYRIKAGDFVDTKRMVLVK